MLSRLRATASGSPRTKRVAVSAYAAATIPALAAYTSTHQNGEGRGSPRSDTKAREENVINTASPKVTTEDAGSDCQYLLPGRPSPKRSIRLRAFTPSAPGDS